MDTIFILRARTLHPHGYTHIVDCAMREMHRISFRKRHFFRLVIFALLSLCITCILLVTTRSRPWSCKNLHHNYSQTNESLRASGEEEYSTYSIAYSIVVYTDPTRVERLLRAIYHPDNTYCIHVDKKSSKDYYGQIENYAASLGLNVFLVPRPSSIDVKWGRISVLDADLICARLLLARNKNWRYWINLTGQEFPLRTNWELVTALRQMNGTNLVDATYRRRNLWRFPPKESVPFDVSPLGVLEKIPL